MAMKHPPHPDRLIKDEIDALELTIAEAAQGLGVAPSHLEGLVAGEKAVSPEMAVRLEKAIGSSADMWLRLQLAFDLAQVRNREAEIVVTRLAPQAA